MTTPLASRRSEAGMTLVEVMVCVALLGFVTVGIMALLTVAMRQNKLAQMRSVATGLGSGRIQQITSLTYQGSATYLKYKLPYEVAAAGPPMTFTAGYGTIPSYPDYKIVTTLSYDVPVSGMLRVQTVVSWTDVAQGQKSHKMVTYLHPALEGGGS